MLTPVLIQIMFVLGSLVWIAAGFVAIGGGATNHQHGRLAAGIALVVLGPIVVRLWAEVLIVVFRINGSLNDLLSLAVWTAEREHEFDSESLNEE